MCCVATIRPSVTVSTRALCRLFKPLTEETRQRALCDLRAWASVSHDRSPSPRMLTREDVRRLGEVPGVEVGAHTASHQVLANLPLNAQRKEIASSKECLEAIMGRPVRTFAYPYGTEGGLYERHGGARQRRGVRARLLELSRGRD